MWKMAGLEAALPACPHAAVDGGEPVYPDEDELAESLRDIYASLKAMRDDRASRFADAWADVRVVRLILSESPAKETEHALRAGANFPRQALRASLQAMGFGEWDDARLTAAIKAATGGGPMGGRPWDVKLRHWPPNTRFLRMPPSWPCVGVEQAAQPRRSSFSCECARCRFDAACGRDQEARRIGDLALGERLGDLADGDYAAKNRAGRACDALRAQLPMYTHAENPRHSGGDDRKKFLVVK